MATAATACEFFGPHRAGTQAAGAEQGGSARRVFLFGGRDGPIRTGHAQAPVERRGAEWLLAHITGFGPLRCGCPSAGVVAVSRARVRRRPVWARSAVGAPGAVRSRAGRPGTVGAGGSGRGRVRHMAPSARGAGLAASGASEREAEGRPRTGRTRMDPATRRVRVPGVAGQAGFVRHGSGRPCRSRAAIRGGGCRAGSGAGGSACRRSPAGAGGSRSGRSRRGVPRCR